MQLVLAVAGMLVMAILAAGIVSWVLAALKVAGGQPLVPWSRRRPVPWGLLDLGGTIAIFVALYMVLESALSVMGWLPEVAGETDLTLADKEFMLWANIGIQIGLLVIVLPLIALRTGALARDFGLAALELASDIKLGVIGFVMLAPPVYAIQGVLVYFWKPSKHPLMEMFKESPDTGFFVVLLVAAAVMAPIFEELIFRVLLQGFLEKLFSFRHKFAELFHGRSPNEVVTVVPSIAQAEPAIVLRPADASQNPFLPSAIVSDDIVAAEFADPAEQPELRGFRSWLPILVASLVFALMHVSHGPDWVALTLLAAGMGYLYQRTHRLAPSLVIHALINSLSMFGLWIQVYAMPEQG